MSEIPINQPFPVAGETIFTHTVTRIPKGYSLVYSWHTSTGETCTENDEFPDLPQIEKYIASCRHTIFCIHYESFVKLISTHIPADDPDMNLAMRSLSYFLKQDFKTVHKYFNQIFQNLKKLAAVVPGMEAKTKLLQLETFIKNN